MDNLFLKRVNSWIRLVKKEQESIFGKSMGSLYNPQFFLKILFRHAPVLSNDPQATQTALVLKIDHPFRSPSRRLIFKDLEEKHPGLSDNWVVNDSN